MDTVKRKEDATSKETLKDLEDEETVDTNETDGPSPDGAFDEEDELKDADPV
jgi:hypothetical protein